MKKNFELYENDKKLGVITVFWDTIQKNYVAGSLSLIMTVTSLTSCSIYDYNKELNIVATTTFNERDKKIGYRNLKEEIEKKEYFVNQVLNSLYEDKKHNAQILYYTLLNDYKKISEIEFKDNVLFVLNENEQEKIVSMLNYLIDIIENKTNWKYNYDFILFTLENDLSKEEEITRKLSFVNSVLDDLNVLRQKKGNTYAEFLYNELISEYFKYAKIENNLDPQNEEEYNKIILFSSIEKEQEKMISILDNIISIIEEKTTRKYNLPTNLSQKLK